MTTNRLPDTAAAFFKQLGALADRGANERLPMPERIEALGQLEGLLGTDAAVDAAYVERHTKERKQRKQNPEANRFPGVMLDGDKAKR